MTYASPGHDERRACAACALALAAVLLPACAGSGAGAQKPSAVLSSSIQAEAELRAITAPFASASHAERLALESKLEAFRAKYPADALARPADALLAWIALESGRYLEAETRARGVRRIAGAGTVGDIARTVEGAALRRRRRPVEALELLSPLVSKLVDGWARSLLNQEIVGAAVEAGRWDRALELMSVWLREAGPDERATARAHLEQSLEQVPGPDLSRWLRRERGIELAQASGEEVEIRKLVAQRLAKLARADKDPELAAQLLGAAGTLLGDHGDAIAALAAGSGKARVVPRTVGLLLSFRDDKTRRRGAEIAAGVAFGLGLPGSPARLASRHDHGEPDRIEEALSALTADGASIIIAGSDERDATLAAAFAEARRVPVILLRPPAAGALTDNARFAFVAGFDPIDLEGSLSSALAARTGGPVAVLADEPIRLRARRAEVSVVRGCSQASADWKPLGVGGVVLSGHPDCSRAAVAAGAPLRLRFAVGLEAGTLRLPPRSLVATAGLFPPAQGAPPNALKAWFKEHAAPPSFWAALARDVAVLAWAAVEALPAQGTEDPREVAERRERASAALANATAHLWTTDAKGFGGARVLPRTLRVRDVASHD